MGRPRRTSPWCPPALHGLAHDRVGAFIPTCPAKHHGGGSPLCLLPLSPGPHYMHATPPYTLPDPLPRGTEWGARLSASYTSGTVHHPPKGRGTQSHGCELLAARYYQLGGVWPADHGSLVRGPIPRPRPCAASCQSCPREDTQTPASKEAPLHQRTGPCWSRSE